MGRLFDFKRLAVGTVMAVVLAASWAGAQYTVCSGDYAGFCKWDDECSAISIMPGESWSKATCAEAYENCASNGEMFLDEDCTQRKAGSVEACGSYCQWDDACWEIKTDPTGANGTVSTTCAEAIANCDADGQRWSAPPLAGPGPGQCTGTMLGGVQGCGYYCKWDSGCYEIKPDPTGENGTASADCQEAIANCDADGARYSNSTCTGTQVGGEESCSKYCYWAETGECVEIKTDKAGQHNPEPVTSCADALANCATNGAMYSDASCTIPSSVNYSSSKLSSSTALYASYAKSGVLVSWKSDSNISSGKISLVNIKGKTVASTSIKASGRNVSARLGKTSLPAGTYFVRINARDINGKQIVQQVSVQIVK